MKIGKIPEKLKIFARSEEELSFRWDDIDDSESRTVNGKAIFVADSTNAKTQETGESWASQSYYDYTQKKYVSSQSEEFEWNNVPLTDIRIVTLEHRGNGGRAYKVLIGNKYIYDLREDILLDTMIHEGIREDAILNGSFIFATVGSQMKLIRVGSLLHQKLLEYSKHKKAEPIKDFEVGGVYKSSTKEVLYLGKFTTPDGIYNYSEVWDRSVSGGFYNTGRRCELRKVSSPKTFHVFLEPYKDHKPDDLFDTLDSGYLRIVKDKPKSYKEKIFQYSESPKELYAIHTKVLKDRIDVYSLKNPEYTPTFDDSYTLLELPEYGESEWVKEKIKKWYVQTV